jgi:phospholipase C
MATTGSAPAQPASLNLQHIKHVVVLMLENRSFDNLLGWLYHETPPPRGQSFAGLTPDLWCPLDNIDAFGMPFVEKVPVRKNGDVPPHARGRGPGTPDFTLPAPDPGEGYHYTNHQLFQRYEVSAQFTPEPTNQGFVNDYRDALLYNTYSFGEPPTDPREIMTCYTPEQVPVLSELARQFAVCDHWFGSVPSQTLPNRHFTHAATSDGQVNNSHEPCRSRTIFNQIQEAIDGGRSDLSWRVYCGTGKDRATGKVTLFSLTRLVMEQLHDATLDPNFQPIEEFYKAAAAGTLPTYAFLEPQIHSPGANDQHPPQDVRWGDRLIADIYRALASSPQWDQTLLVITYDEHGGCYDHVPPPGGAAPPVRGGAPGQFGFGFDRFGVRVPTVLVSPWIEAGTVCRAPGRTPFDHTSIIATVRQVAGLPEPLTERDKAAPDLGCAMTLAAPRTDTPAVTPLEIDTGTDSPTHDLHHAIAQFLEKLSGEERPDEQEISDFVHAAYEKYFANRTSR